jgi:O-acetyl-ADP-ribose deacetylase (regulator of RNase III)
MNDRFKLVLCDFSQELCDEWKLAFADFPEVEIRQGRFQDVDFDCVNSPANSFGLMDGGFDEALAMHFGDEMVQRVQERIIEKYAGEQPVGTSEIIVGKVELDGTVKFVAHTPTMIIPYNITNTSNVYLAMKASLLAVEAHNKRVSTYAGLNVGDNTYIKTHVVSGLGTGAGRVPYKRAAIEMAKAYQVYKNRPKNLSWPFATGRYQYIRGNNV